MGNKKAILVKFTPSGKRLPYWDRYEYECIDCGEHFTRATHTSRINPYCSKCYKIHEREEARKREQRKKHELYNKGVNDLVNAIIKDIENEGRFSDMWNDYYKTYFAEDIILIADNLKECAEI